MRLPSLPTSRRDVRLTARTTGRVLRRPRWLLVAAAAATVAVTLFVAFDRPVYLRTVVFGGGLSPLDRVRALLHLLPALVPGRGLLRAVLLYLTAGAVGANVALLGYHLVHNDVSLSEGSGGLLAVALGTLGAGCAPCGLAVVASGLSLSGVAAGLTVLPLEGAEFLLAALAATGLSIHWLATGLRAGERAGCPVEV